MGLKAVVIERLGGYGGSFIGTEGMTGLETKYTSGENCPVFAGAYNPTAPYGVKNALNTCFELPSLDSVPQAARGLLRPDEGDH